MRVPNDTQTLQIRHNRPGSSFPLRPLQTPAEGPGAGSSAPGGKLCPAPRAPATPLHPSLPLLGRGFGAVRELLTNNGWGRSGRKMLRDLLGLARATPSLVNRF